MYHRVQSKKCPDIEKFSDIYRIKETLVSEDVLREDIQFLLNQGWKSVSLEKLSQKEKAFHLSFDDGYVEHINVVAPALRKLGIREATFSINTGTFEKGIFPPLDIIYFSVSRYGMANILKKLDLPDGLNLNDSLSLFKKITNKMTVKDIEDLPGRLSLSSDDISFIKEQYLKPENIASLSYMGFGVCSHGFAHRDMRFHRKDSLIELIKSRKSLSNLLQKPVNAFCFPDGQYDSLLIGQCKKAGYETMLAIKSNNEPDVLGRTFATEHGVWRKAI
jgi:peptidoglycan/xylan/chitin deacetylase (PgdA/CDA1 family)